MNYNRKGQIQEVAGTPSDSSKTWIYVLVLVVLVAVIGLLVFVVLNHSSKSLSGSELTQGTALELKANNAVKFLIGQEEHTITVNSIKSNSVTVTIQSSPVQFDINVGEEKRFDVNSDGFYDVSVKLNSITNGVPKLFIKQIHEAVCTESWSCGTWGSCTIGEQIRTCTDLNSCGTIVNKPSITQSCISVNNSIQTCAENWHCGSWSSCNNGQQTRACNDSKNCGTTASKPSTQQSCGTQVIDCGSAGMSATSSTPIITASQNFDCFIEASETCAPAKLSDTTTVELFGMFVTVVTKMELKGIESNKCIYYQKTINQTMEFTDELIQQMLDSGSTQEEINQQLQESNDVAKETWGLARTCKFNKVDLTAMLNRWWKSPYEMSSSDYDVAECTEYS